jgi:hypothetical protein
LSHGDSVIFKIRPLDVARCCGRRSLFSCAARTGPKDAQVLEEMIDAFAAWFEGAIAPL